MKIASNDALLVVDVQNDFIPGGALSVVDGDQIIPEINRISKIFQKNNSAVILTQDWHPKDHQSFATAHEGKNPFDPFQGPGLGPVLWPPHCLQGTKGAAFPDGLDIVPGVAIIRKGTNPEIDSYSAFLENDKKTETGLSGYLKSRGIGRIFFTGLALDFCVRYSAVDARKFGFDAVVIEDLTKGIDNPEGNIAEAIEEMKNEGVTFLESSAF